jgi:hypothetical protein
MNNTIKIYLMLLLLTQTILSAVSWQARAPFRIAPNPTDNRKQQNAQICYDGKATYLVVWQQGNFFSTWQNGDIFAARVDTAGVLLDSTPIPVCTLSASNQELPAVSFSGSTFLVVWSDLRNGKDWDVYGCRIDGQGRMLDPNGIAIAADSGSECYPRLAPDANGFLISYQEKFHRNDSSGFYHICVAYVGEDGVVKNYGTLQDGSGKRLYGGACDIIRVNNFWCVSRLDQLSAGIGCGTPIGLSARIVKQGETCVVLGQTQALAGPSRPKFVHGTSTFISVSAEGIGRGLGTIGLMFDTASAAILPNPNKETDPGASCFTTTQIFCPYDCANFYTVIGQSAVAFGQNYYLTIVKQSVAGNAPGYSTSLKTFYLSSRINESGLRVDSAMATPIYSGTYPLSPAMVGRSDGFFMTFSENIGSSTYLLGMNFKFEATTTSTENLHPPALRTEIVAQPNPFNPAVKLRITGRGYGTLRIYNAQGVRVADLSNAMNRQDLRLQERQLEWNAAGFASGVYFTELVIGNISIKRRIVLIY